MKFNCKCEDLRKEIGYAINFTNKRNALIISSNVLLENYNNTLTIKATDGKNGFVGRVEVETVVPGATTVICDKLFDVLKNIAPETALEVSEENDKLSLRGTSDSKFLVNIRTIAADKFPEMNDREEDDSFFTISQAEFFDMVDKTSFSVSRDESRFFLTGVYFEKKNDRLVMVATDGKRLACVRRECSEDIPSFMPAIIPVNFLANLRSIGSGDGVLSLSIKDGYIYANIEGRFIYSLLITGQYPNYERVIPKEFANSCVAAVSDMLNAINLISVTIEMKSKKIYLDLNVDGIMVSGEDNDGDSKNIVQCEYAGDPLKLVFNYNFLQDAIKKIGSPNFSIHFNSANAAIGITPEVDSDYIFIIMPMQL